MTAVLIQSLIAAGIYGILALSLNLQYGLTGIMNFGQVIFFAVGAYSVATVQAHGGPDWLGIVIAPLAGAVAAALIALPSSRLSEAFWALVSLAMASLFVVLMTNVNSVAGGTQGTFEISLWSNTTILVVLAAVLGCSIVIIERIRKSQLGRIMRVAREDDLLLLAMGRSVTKVRSTVLVLSGVLGSFSGVVYAHWVTYISPDPFTMSVTLMIFTMVILGGSGNTYGVLVGVAVIEGVTVGLQYLPLHLSGGDLGVLEQIINGVVLVGFLLFLNRGVFPERKQVHRIVAR